MSQIFIKPASKGLIIRDPSSGTPLSEQGEWKPIIGFHGKYWNRRILDGSVIKAEQGMSAIQQPEEKQEEKKYRGGKK